MALDPITAGIETLGAGLKFGSTLSDSKTRRMEAKSSEKKQPIEFLSGVVASRTAESIQKEKTKQVVLFSILGLVLVGGLVLALKKK
jgi:hypothetical protein